MLMWIISFISGADAFIVPQEIPSLLSLVYSNIPPIKKGNTRQLIRLKDMFHDDEEMLIRIIDVAVLLATWEVEFYDRKETFCRQELIRESDSDTGSASMQTFKFSSK